MSGPLTKECSQFSAPAKPQGRYKITLRTPRPGTLVPSLSVRFLLYAIPEGFLMGPYFTLIEVSVCKAVRQKAIWLTFLCSSLYKKWEFKEFSWKDPHPNSDQVANDYIFKFIYFFGLGGFFSFFSFTDCREREEGGRKRGRETSIGCICPNWELNLQPRHVPWPGIKPVTICFAGRCSANWTTPARVYVYLWHKHCHKCFFKIYLRQQWLTFSKRM